MTHGVHLTNLMMSRVSLTYVPMITGNRSMLTHSDNINISDLHKGGCGWLNIAFVTLHISLVTIASLLCLPSNKNGFINQTNYTLIHIKLPMLPWQLIFRVYKIAFTNYMGNRYMLTHSDNINISDLHKGGCGWLNIAFVALHISLVTQ